MITGLYCFTYDVEGHCQHILMTADSLETAEQHAEEAKPADWVLVEGFEIPVQDLPNGVALPWF